MKEREMREKEQKEKDAEERDEADMMLLFPDTEEEEKISHSFNESWRPSVGGWQRGSGGESFAREVCYGEDTTRAVGLGRLFAGSVSSLVLFFPFL